MTTTKRLALLSTPPRLNITWAVFGLAWVLASGAGCGGDMAVVDGEEAAVETSELAAGSTQTCQASGNPPWVTDVWGRSFPTVWCVSEGSVLFSKPGSGDDDNGWLDPGTSWFVCQKMVGNRWYAYTQGEAKYEHRNGAWGWIQVGHIYSSGKLSNGASPVRGLVNCSRYGI
jgi:hypothetical protein